MAEPEFPYGGCRNLKVKTREINLKHTLSFHVKEYNQLPFTLGKSVLHG